MVGPHTSPDGVWAGRRLRLQNLILDGLHARVSEISIDLLESHADIQTGGARADDSNGELSGLSSEDIGRTGKRRDAIGTALIGFLMFTDDLPCVLVAYGWHDGKAG